MDTKDLQLPRSTRSIRNWVAAFHKFLWDDMNKQFLEKMGEKAACRRPIS